MQLVIGNFTGNRLTDSRITSLISRPRPVIFEAKAGQVASEAIANPVVFKPKATK